MKSANPNPAGREGKPFSLYPRTFDEVVQKMLNTPPSKSDPKPAKKSAKKVPRKR
jgi:hypothetical protein